MVADSRQILDPLEYCMSHLDGACWVSVYFLIPRPGETEIRVNGDLLIRRPSMAGITNALAEAGIIKSRQVLNFLGIRLKKGELHPVAIPRPYPDDAGVEQLGLPLVTVDELLAAPTGDAQDIRTACLETLRAADKGVAHLTVDLKQRLKPKDLLLCARTTIWAVKTFVYGRGGLPVPRFEFWTGGALR